MQESCFCIKPTFCTFFSDVFISTIKPAVNLSFSLVDCYRHEDLRKSELVSRCNGRYTSSSEAPRLWLPALTLQRPFSRIDDGNVWATTLCGQPGFMQAIEKSHLSIELKQAYGDPVRFREGLPFGSVGVMLHNRRRNKLNGRVESLSPNSLTLSVSQAIGNCPKYIQRKPLKGATGQSG